MMKKIEYTKQFKKAYQRLTYKDRLKFERNVKLLIEDFNHPSLRVHKLSGNLAGFYAFSISFDLRCIFKIDEETIVLINIGSHSFVY